jgi:hypothetical protein
MGTGKEKGITCQAGIQRQQIYFHVFVFYPFH